MTSMKVQAIVLAAGKSTRFSTSKSKQLFEVCGKPMILYSLSMLNSLSIRTTLILGHQWQVIKDLVHENGLADISVVLQKEQRGTGHAVQCCQDTWDADHILIINGDSPLLESCDVQALYEKHVKSNAAISFFVTHAFDPSGYGRVIGSGINCRIVEEKECTFQEREVTKINAGVYILRREFLQTAIAQLQPHTTTELYITDLIAYAGSQGLVAQSHEIAFDIVRGVNTLEELWQVEQIMRCKFIKQHMANGVRFTMPLTVHVDANVTIAKDSVIGAGVQLINGTVLGNRCCVDAYSLLNNTVVDDDVHIYSHSILHDSTVKKGARVGPFARLRSNAIIQQHAIVGNFVEIKKSTLGKYTKAKHLAYLGDAHVGEKVNLGAGTITCNHDSVQKHTTIIDDGAYVGSGSLLIAPLSVGKDAFVAAGSTVTHDVQAQDLAIARSRQQNKQGYAQKLKIRLKKQRDLQKQQGISFPYNAKNEHADLLCQTEKLCTENKTEKAK